MRRIPMISRSAVFFSDEFSEFGQNSTEELLQRAASLYQAGLYLLAMHWCDLARENLERVQPESELIEWCRECSIWCRAKWSFEVLRGAKGAQLVNMVRC